MYMFPVPERGYPLQHEVRPRPHRHLFKRLDWFQPMPRPLATKAAVAEPTSGRGEKPSVYEDRQATCYRFHGGHARDERRHALNSVETNHGWKKRFPNFLFERTDGARGAS